MYRLFSASSSSWNSSIGSIFSPWGVVSYATYGTLSSRLCELLLWRTSHTEPAVVSATAPAARSPKTELPHCHMPHTLQISERSRTGSTRYNTVHLESSYSLGACALVTRGACDSAQLHRIFARVRCLHTCTYDVPRCDTHISHIIFGRWVQRRSDGMSPVRLPQQAHAGGGWVLALKPSTRGPIKPSSSRRPVSHRRTACHGSGGRLAAECKVTALDEAHVLRIRRRITSREKKVSLSACPSLANSSTTSKVVFRFAGFLTVSQPKRRYSRGRYP